MPRYSGKLFLSTDFENYIDPFWADIGNVSIPTADLYSGGARYATIEGEPTTFASWTSPERSTQKQQNFWNSYGGAFKRASGSIVFSSNPNIDLPVTQALAQSSGRYWDDETQTYYDLRTNNSADVPGNRIYNPFIIGTVPGQDNAYFVLVFKFNRSGKGEGTNPPSPDYYRNSGATISLATYTETKDSDGNRTTWTYYGGLSSPNNPWDSSFEGLAEGVQEVSFDRTDYSRFNNVCFAKGKWGNYDGRFIVLGQNDSGEFPSNPNSGFSYSQVLFITETVFDARLEEVPDYGPQPDENDGDAFKVSQMKTEAIASRKITDRDPYGLNSAYTGLVAIDKSYYSALIGNIFGGATFSDSNETVIDPVIQGGDPYNKKFATVVRKVSGNSADYSKPVGVDIVNQALGINQEIRQEMCDAVLSLNIFPNYFSGASGTISTLSGYQLKNPIPCTVIGNTIVETTFSANIPMPSDSFISFEPYVNIQIFLPYIGTVAISPSVLFENVERMSYNGYPVKLIYNIDAYTGLVSCEVRIGDNYTYCVKQGNCASPIPLIGAGRNGQSERSILSGLASIAASPIAFATGNVSGGVNSLIEGFSDIKKGQETLDYNQPLIGVSSANIAAMLSPTQPFWVMTYKKACMPEPSEYKGILGNMRNKYTTVGACSGMTTFYDVNLSKVNATQAVKEQILARLRSGVII